MRRASLALVAACVLIAGGVRAAEEPVTLNFVNADIEAVAAAIGKMTNRNFVIDPRVQGTINIVSARPVPSTAVYGIFLSALRLQGFTAVESGGVTKILPEADAKLHGGPVGTRGAASGNLLQTQVYTLKYTSAAQLMPVLRPIISPNNTIAVFAGNNSLVITDYGDNLRRIESIIEAVDRPGGGGEPVVVPLRFAAVADVMQTLSRVLPDSVASAPGQAAAIDASARLYVAQDPRTNSIVVRSENPARVEQVRALVRQLDVQTGAAANVHVVYLKNAEATRVAQTLRGILSGEVAPIAPSHARAPGAQPSAAAQPPHRGSGARHGAGGLGVERAPDLGARRGVRAHQGDHRQARRAPRAGLRRSADRGDDRRQGRRVRHPVAIAPGLSRGRARRVSAAPTSRAPGPAPTSWRRRSTRSAWEPGINVGVVRGQVTIPGIGVVTNLAMLARALETDAKANILSTPNLLTLDNEEARIVIGQNMPLITGQYAQTGSATTVTPFQTIERRDVGLTLRVKPQISEGGTVRLQIYQEVSAVRDTTLAGVTLDKRAIESTVLIDDGQIIALGGLVQDDVRAGMEKVPLLGDIPLLGVPVPLRDAQADEDQPHGVPAAGRSARRRSA